MLARAIYCLKQTITFAKMILNSAVLPEKKKLVFLIDVDILLRCCGECYFVYGFVVSAA
ncbi:MAG: hypothetical protein LBT09_07210 [Planctomycetaceae bacterium]|nr:hypothetical protein [Planctomycetaceae bacterium]